jgi:hypothetical protein
MDKTTFSAYSPIVKKQKVGGGFKVEVEVSEDQYEMIKDLNSPRLDGIILKVTIEDS